MRGLSQHTDCDMGSHPSTRTGLECPVLGWGPVPVRGVPFWGERSHPSPSTGMGAQSWNGVSCTGMGDPISAAVLGCGPALAQKSRMGAPVGMGARYRDGALQWDLALWGPGLCPALGTVRGHPGVTRALTRTAVSAHGAGSAGAAAL